MHFPLDAVQKSPLTGFRVFKSLGASLCNLSGSYLHYPKVIFCVMDALNKMFVFLVLSHLLPDSVF